MFKTNHTPKDDTGYTTLLAAMFILIATAIFSSAPAKANNIVAAESVVHVVFVEAIVVTATRLK